MYIFLANNPINDIDPLGLQECECGETPTFHPGEFIACYVPCHAAYFWLCLGLSCGACIESPNPPRACLVCVAIVGPACSFAAGEICADPCADAATHCD